MSTIQIQWNEIRKRRNKYNYIYHHKMMMHRFHLHLLVLLYYGTRKISVGAIYIIVKKLRWCWCFPSLTHHEELKISRWVKFRSWKGKNQHMSKCIYLEDNHRAINLNVREFPQTIFVIKRAILYGKPTCLLCFFWTYFYQRI